MSNTASSNEVQTPITFELDTIVSIESAPALRDSLEQLSEAGCDVVLDGRNVEMLDTTALQLLLAFTHKVKRDGFRVSWQSPSPVVIGTTALAGVDVELGV